MGLVRDVDIRKVTVMDDVEGDEDIVLADGWDAVNIE